MKNAKRYLLAHDLGTSGNKATLFTIDGELVATSTSPYKTNFFNNNWAEQNPLHWWQAVCMSSRELIQHISANEIAAVCFSGQMMGCLCVDAQGTPMVVCQTCHGKVEEMEIVSVQHPFNMQWCLNCHRKPEMKTSTDCVVCHR